MKDIKNYLFPFFWQHGEDEEKIIEYVEKIAQSGMKAVCVESRPHPDFAGPQWFRDLKIIIRECKKHDMKVWILDDSHFPTGYANGRIKKDFPHLRKQYLAMRRFDMAGPFAKARLDANLLKGRPWAQKNIEIEEVLGVYLVERLENNQLGDPILVDTVRDITSSYHNDEISLDIPKGSWSVFVIFSTYEGGEEQTKDYLNPLVKEATEVLLEEVYERHYKEMGEEFGQTITAFFSDEPRFGNAKGTDCQLGDPELFLPWAPGLERHLSFDKSLLPLLWVPASKQEEREIRYAYMDCITRLYSQNFTKVLADWSKNHGVFYLGHNIEDNGAHARLGYGAGHFFRAQEAQHYSGIDVIASQIVPGMPYHHDAFQTGGADGQFYHYALAKLGSSAAHLSPHKQGRAMCEAFGAYGWNEGLKTMKWIADHLLVRGINHLVPHAFSPKAFPDWDCPPHFYANGHNPQFPYMANLTVYLNRLMTLFNGGQHKAPLALFYPGECEWAGQAMPIEEVAKVLTQQQLDFDIVSYDHLCQATVEHGVLHIAQEEFRALILPACSYMPQAIAKHLAELVDQSLQLVWVERLPENIQDIEKQSQLVTLLELGAYLESLAELRLEKHFKDLVYYHYEKEGYDYWLFFNESLWQTVDTAVSLLNQKEQLAAYDAYLDQIQDLLELEEGYHLYLPPYQTIVWTNHPDFVKSATSSSLYQSQKEILDVEFNDWQVSFSDAETPGIFEPVPEITLPTALSDYAGYERVCGTVAYETNFEVSDKNNPYLLDLGVVYEIAEVFVNRQSAGIRIAPPYRYDLAKLIQEGKNHLRIEVTNTLGTKCRGGLSQYLLVEPFGLMEKPKIFK